MARKWWLATLVAVLAGYLPTAFILAEGATAAGAKLADEVQLTLQKGESVIAFKPPLGWQKTKNPLLLNAPSYMAPKPLEKDGYVPTLMITFYHSGTALRVYVSQLKLKLGKFFRGFVREREQYLDIGEAKAWQVESLFSRGDEDLRSLQTILSVEGWKVSFTFTARADEFSGLKSLFQQSTKSFRLVQNDQGREQSEEVSE